MSSFLTGHCWYGDYGEFQTLRDHAEMSKIGSLLYTGCAPGNNYDNHLQLLHVKCWKV